MSSLQQLITMPGIWFTLTASIQLFAVSLLGLIAVKAVARRSAPLRSMVAMSAMILLMLTPAVSAFFHFSHISWWTPPVPVPVVSMPDEVIPLPDFKPAEMKVQPEKKTSAQVSTARVLPAAGTEKSAVKSRFNFDYGQAVIFAGIIWLAGMAFMLGRLAYGLIFLRGFNFGLKPVKDSRFDVMLRNAAERFGQEKSPLMFTSPRVESPITVGISKPVVIIPEKLIGHLSDDEMKSILMHELSHIYSCDHLAGVFKRIVIAANWWNPLVYIISNEHSAAREDVADNYALLELHPKVYSECLVGLAEKTCLINSFPATAGMAGRYSSLEQRVRNILSKKRTLIMKTGKSIRLAAVLSCGILAFAIAGIQAASADEKAETAENKAVEGRTLSISEVAEGAKYPIDTYYGGDVETDWISLNVPPFAPNPAGLSDTSTFSTESEKATVRNDELFQKEWPSFKIQSVFGKDYRPGGSAYIKTSPFSYNPSKPYASAFRIMELSSTDAQGKTRVVYNVSSYRLFNNTSFPLYGLDQLFPVPGEYTLKGKIYFFSMSGSDMVAEKLAVNMLVTGGINVKGPMAVGTGVYNPDKALETLEKLQKKYPFHSLDLPESKITAVEK